MYRNDELRKRVCKVNVGQNRIYDIYVFKSIIIIIIVTWLILPVVICLFRRLSHASLSSRKETAECSLQ